MLPTRTLPIVLATIITRTLLQAGIDDLVITEISPETDQVEVTHFSGSAWTTNSSLPFCHRFNYSSAIPSGTEFGPNESLVFSVSGLNDSGSDIWLYRDGNFSSSASILTGAQYGGGNQGRAGVASSAGIWPTASTTLPAPGSGQTLRLSGSNSGDPANWSEGNPQLDTIIDILDDPLPDVPDFSEPVGLRLVAENLVSPVSVFDPDDGSGRLLIQEQSGVVQILRGGQIEANPFLDVSATTLSDRPGFEERGLIGFALHPEFKSNGLIYTYTSEPVSGTPDFTATGSTVDHHGVIAEWNVMAGDPDQIDPASRRELIRFESPQFNHNGGELLFDGDGHLLIAIGDGGGANDNDPGHGPTGNGQNPANVLGAILRIDPAGSDSANGQYGIPEDNPLIDEPGALDEIYAYGLRNPFRMTRHPVTGTILVADVGQNNIEEINILQAGANYGWRVKEGSFFFDESTGNVASGEPFEPFPNPEIGFLVDPIAEYDHDEGLSIIGGHFLNDNRFRGAPDGLYLFGDFTGKLFVLDSDQVIHRLPLGLTDRSLNTSIKGFGTSADGRIFVCTAAQPVVSGSSGKVYEIIPVVAIEGFVKEDDSLAILSLIADEGSGTLLLERFLDLRDSPVEQITPTRRGPGLFDAEIPMEGVARSFFRPVIE